MINYLLFLFARTAAIITMPLGILYTIVRRHKRLRTMPEYFLNIAYAFDCLINAVFGDLFNDILAKPGGYPYGKPEDSISRATGKNELVYKLKKLGIKLKNFLNRIDPGHTQRAAK